MLYRFHGISGRIVRAGQSLGQGIKAGTIPEPIIIHDSHSKFPKISNEPVGGGGRISASGIVYGEVPQALRERMKKFQVDDNVPVHLKGGTTDQALFGFTVLLCAVGLFESFRYFYSASFPQKVDE